MEAFLDSVQVFFSSLPLALRSNVQLGTMVVTFSTIIEVMLALNWLIKI